MIGILLFLPFVFASLMYFKSSQTYRISLVSSLILLTLSLVNHHISSYDIQELSVFNSEYFLTFSCNKISSLFIVLTSFLLFVTVVASHNIVEEYINRYYTILFVLTGIIFGFFLTTDIITFYVCFELSLVPMFLLIGTFGSTKRITAAFKLLLYTIFGSLFFLIAMIYLILKTGNTKISMIVEGINAMPIEIQTMLWICFMIAFLIKIPVIPFHSWLPVAHVEAPMGGSVFLAGIIIKMGAYGILKIILPAFHIINLQYQNIMFSIGLISIIYASLIILKQTDIKKMIAYSSIAHMGYVVIALFSLNINGLYGAIIQMISHGFISAGLFILIGLLYNQTHTREIGYYGDLATSMPKFSFLFLVLSFANIGLPTTSGFVGEFLSIISASEVNFVVAGIMCVGVVLSALYMLKLVKKLIYSNYAGMIVLKDIGQFAIFAIITICICVILFGIAPNLLLSRNDIINFVSSYYYLK